MIQSHCPSDRSRSIFFGRHLFESRVVGFSDAIQRQATGSEDHIMRWSHVGSNLLGMRFELGPRQFPISVRCDEQHDRFAEKFVRLPYGGACGHFRFQLCEVLFNLRRMYLIAFRFDH